MKILSSGEGKKAEYSVENWFTASANPLYIGIIAKPSPGLWEYLSRSKSVILESDGPEGEYKICTCLASFSSFFLKNRLNREPKSIFMREY